MSDDEANKSAWVRELHARGHTLFWVGEITGCSQSYIKRVLRRSDKIGRPAKVRYTPEGVAEACRDSTSQGRQVMHKFKVGDRVIRTSHSCRPLEFGMQGREYTVLDVTYTGIRVIKGKPYVDPRSFELVKWPNQSMQELRDALELEKLKHDETKDELEEVRKAAEVLIDLTHRTLIEAEELICWYETFWTPR
jgi:hypothetical protein